MRSLILSLLTFILLSSGIAKCQMPVNDTPLKLEELFDMQPSENLSALVGLDVQGLCDFSRGKIS